MSLEKELIKRKRRANLQDFILATVGVTGVLAVGLVAPNILWAMKKMGMLPHKRQKESIISSKNNLTTLLKKAIDTTRLSRGSEVSRISSIVRPRQSDTKPSSM